MTIPLAIFLLFIFTCFFSTGVQTYIHQEAYPLLAYVGAKEFPGYLKEFEQRLTLPLVLPWTIAVLSNIVLLFIRPANVSLIWLIIALVINISTAGVTVGLATPVYNRYKQTGEPNGQVVQQLVRINSFRLILSIVTSIIVVYLLILLITR